jgi:Heterokaryon incompatibility protein (HET)
MALSYVWVQQNQDRDIRCKVANLERYCTDGGLMQVDLPQTIKDVIQLVRDLDKRYFWIDAL